MLKKHFLLLCASLALIAFVIVGCGDDKSDTSSTTEATSTASESGGKVRNVNIKDIKFLPQTLNAKVGETIKWTNKDPVGHNAVATEGADFKSETLNTNDTFEYKVTKPGTINYECTIHPGQTGKIVVS